MREGLSPLDKVRAEGQLDTSNQRQSNRAVVTEICREGKVDEAT